MHNHTDETVLHKVSRELQHPQVQTLRYEGSDLPRKRNPCDSHQSGAVPLTKAILSMGVNKVYPIDQHTEGRTGGATLNVVKHKSERWPVPIAVGPR